MQPIVIDRRIALAALVIIVMFFLGAVATIRTSMDAKNLLNDISGNTPSAVDRRRATAEERFILCSRGNNVVDDAKADEVALVCEGYDTLEEAYETQRTTAP